MMLKKDKVKKFGLIIKKLKENFSVSYSEKTIRWGIATAFVLLFAVVLYIFPNRAAEYKAFRFGYGAFMMPPFLIGFLVAFRFKILNNILNTIHHFALMLIMPFFTLIMSEILNGLLEFGFTPLSLIGGYCLILFLIFCVFAISGSFKISFITVNTVVLLLSITNFYVFSFRGTPFLPLDFFAAQTAANVSSTYDFLPKPDMIFAIFIYIVLMIIAIKSVEPKKHIVFKISTRVLTATISVVTVVVYFTTNFFVNLGIMPYFWNQYFSCREQGFLLNFVGNFKFMSVSEPKDYNSADIDKYVAEIYSKTDKIEKTQTPNVICIMNEALSDLSILGDFETNIDYMPFLRGLTENTVKGNLYVPVIGGGTANSEFEFLTGHSMSFLPSGSYPYQLYIRNPISSIVSTLKAQGYVTDTFHPYYANGWNRVNAYGNLGFEKFLSIENMFNDEFLNFFNENVSNPDGLQTYVDNNMPENSNMFLRQYVSDAFDYEVLIDEFENRDKNKPYFMFNVTMQNHGSYTLPASNFDETVKITSLSKEYDATNRYLSLVKKSDEAFEELVEYFSNVDEPTVICMFGDHQPAVEDEFISEILGNVEAVNNDKKLLQRRYATQFYIWANYDIEEKYVDKLSANYLSSLLLDVADIKRPTYNEYLLKLAETLPVIDIAGYIDASDNYYSWDEESPYLDLINNYKKVQYNNLFDQKNVAESIFYINNYQPKKVELSE